MHGFKTAMILCFPLIFFFWTFNFVLEFIRKVERDKEMGWPRGQQGGQSDQLVNAVDKSGKVRTENDAEKTQ